MDHVAILLGGRESQICIRRPNNDVHLERTIPTAKLKAFFKTLEPSRVILKTCAEAFAVARDAKAAGHDVRVVFGCVQTRARDFASGQRPSRLRRDGAGHSGVLGIGSRRTWTPICSPLP